MYAAAWMVRVHAETFRTSPRLPTRKFRDEEEREGAEREGRRRIVEDVLPRGVKG